MASFGSPVLDEILKSLDPAQQKATPRDATRAKARGQPIRSDHDRLLLGALLGGGAQLSDAPSWDDLYRQARQRQLADWLTVTQASMGGLSNTAQLTDPYWLPNRPSTRALAMLPWRNVR